MANVPKSEIYHIIKEKSSLTTKTFEGTPRIDNSLIDVIPLLL